MGIYLNPKEVRNLYKKEIKKPYFVDKTEFLKELIPLVEQEGSNLSITRPRRFGKSVMAAMIASFFCKGIDSSDLFQNLKIAEDSRYEKHLNQHNVIYINFSKAPEECSSYREYIDYIRDGLADDIKETYPEAKHRQGDTIGAMLCNVLRRYDGEMFILVFDEWDYIFHRSYFTEEDRGRFTTFLGDLTKDQPYITMTYMTGILPIKKYSASDTMNHFAEYNMANNPVYGKYFGFTNEEVDDLYSRYIRNTISPNITREELTAWYDGYHNDVGLSLYNPNSVVTALTQNRVGSHWSKAGEYEELKEYVVNDIDGVRDAVMLLAAGESVKTDVSEYATTAPILKRLDQILSVMTVYGYLNYHNGCVRIPNRELELEFDKIMREEPVCHEISGKAWRTAENDRKNPAGWDRIL